MIKCRMPVIVEGKYDRITLSRILDGTVIETRGFGIYRNKELLEMLRVMAKKTGIVVLTDSDAAGFQIRGHIRSAIREGTIVDVYIPDVYGRERRKAQPSKEGKLGVEGLSAALLEEAFRKAGVGAEQVEAPGDPVTKTDLYLWGFTGAEGASDRRRQLLAKLGFPERMSANAMLSAVNVLYNREEFAQKLNEWFPDPEEDRHGFQERTEGH